MAESLGFGGKYVIAGSIAGAVAATTAPGSGSFYSTDFTKRGSVMNAQQSQTAAVDHPTLVSAQLLDAKLEAVEARTDVKFAQLMGKIDILVQGFADLKGDFTRLEGKVDAVDTHTRSGKREIIVAIITTGLAVMALAWAGVQIFEGGLSLAQGSVSAPKK